VLRAQPDSEERAAPPELAVAFPWLLEFHAKRLPGVELVARFDGGNHRAGAGSRVVVSGELVEVVMWLGGRHANSTVEVEGDPDVVDRVLAATHV
jgi:hypothetical protein